MGPLVSPLVTDLLLKYSDRNIFEYFIGQTGHVTRLQTRLFWESSSHTAKIRLHLNSVQQDLTTE